ncbi:tRNA (adenosine(37)-N6)-threonylcarbamoyltransferase complex ATPase subunit type 1 TsaE [Polynucleobacter wuianus]|uniref:tRNA (adenosine(37)-N6)-threonylcarbamoyltransferase complex ATPase subunit type 1 TsaE n=1 Tax=Polynucleobacter wuianus TaxID=1743168 RepID=UPI001C0AEB1E|nr:tRNA (adenosine(37)-N6)-threonylcarbamoyltransferase complex ATPase subunit type 1 TsaE [Polynucleobacter wuianus]MBU3610651.1 tRNA (adenosine(37)-N6)-threonylcarbamoyltransferase complex ATPase subunit type 1 TsaE [Polynucleobacter wuianus]
MAKTLETLKQHCRQEADTACLAKHLAASISGFIEQNPLGHLNISLVGNLGAGKTTFARHLIQSMGHLGKVKSPTYTLCEPYSLKTKRSAYTAHHFDLYRMREPLEWQEVGFAEYFDIPGFCLVEWPEKAEGSLPPFDLEIELMASTDENERMITINAFLNDGLYVLNHLKKILSK